MKLKSFCLQQANDVNAVTREDLAGSLGSCLTAIPEFAEFCIPLILEKLGSNLRVAKLDSLKLLVCFNYLINYLKYFTSIL